MRSTFAVILGLAVFSVVNASEPGQPLDCSDWTFLVPGISCSTRVAYPCAGAIWTACGSQGSGVLRDNTGAYYELAAAPIAEPMCGFLDIDGVQIRRLRLDGTVEVIAEIRDRCVDPLFPQEDYISIQGPGFDPVTGSLLLSASLVCNAPPGNPGYSQRCANYGSAPSGDLIGGRTVFAIDGLGSLFDIFQSYIPVSAPVGFVVPIHPDGLQASEQFDTYYGPLVGPRDFSQAQPLRCNYPATIPQPGDYLEAGVVPDPPSRQGYYYVTAATYQGETRYGRKRENGVLSGRDPAGLPPCALAVAPSVASLR